MRGSAIPSSISVLRPRVPHRLPPHGGTMAAAAATSNGPAAERVGRRDGELQCGSECDCASKQKLKWGERREKKQKKTLKLIIRPQDEEGGGGGERKEMSTRYHRLL